LETYGGLEKDASDNIWDWNCQHFIIMQKGRGRRRAVSLFVERLADYNWNSWKCWQSPEMQEFVTGEKLFLLYLSHRCTIYINNIRFL